MKCCPKKCGISILLCFVFILLYEFVVHSHLLKGLYDQTPQLWRPQDEMKMGFMFAGQFLQALFFVCIACCATGFAKCPISGLKIGALVGLLIAAINLGNYSYQPISCTLACLWMLVGFIKYTTMGAIVGFWSYKCNKKCSS